LKNCQKWSKFVYFYTKQGRNCHIVLKKPKFAFF